jgi:DivIVA domain-containing protein
MVFGKLHRHNRFLNIFGKELPMSEQIQEWNLDDLLQEIRAKLPADNSPAVSLPSPDGNSPAEAFVEYVTAAPAAFEQINDITFDVKFRGFDRRQVTDYIEALAKDYNSICTKNAALQEENEGLRRALAALNRIEVS